MANIQTKASTKYQQKIGLISKSYKLKKDVVDKFAETCRENGVGIAETLTRLMTEYVESNSQK